MSAKSPQTVIEWFEQKTGEPIGDMIAALNLPEPPPETDRHLSVRLPNELAERLRLYAQSHGDTVSQAVRTLVEEALGRHEAAGKATDTDLIAQLDDTVAEVKRRLAG